MSKRTKELERQVTIQQREAARVIVDNEFGLLTEDGRKLSNVQLIERLSTSNNTFYTWKRDSDFVALMNQYADEILDANRAEVYAALMKLVRGGANGTPSVKGIDLYLRRHALLTDKTVIEDARESDRPRKSEDQLAADIIALDELINGK